MGLVCHQVERDYVVESGCSPVRSVFMAGVLSKQEGGGQMRGSWATQKSIG